MALTEGECLLTYNILSVKPKKHLLLSRSSPLFPWYIVYNWFRPIWKCLRNASAYTGKLYTISGARVMLKCLY